MRHGKIMGIINDETLNAILSQQFKEQIFPFPPVPSRSQPQGGQQVVSQRSLTRVIFGSRYSKNRTYLIMRGVRIWALLTCGKTSPLSRPQNRVRQVYFSCRSPATDAGARLERGRPSCSF